MTCPHPEWPWHGHAGRASRSLPGHEAARQFTQEAPGLSGVRQRESRAREPTLAKAFLRWSGRPRTHKGAPPPAPTHALRLCCPPSPSRWSPLRRPQIGPHLVVRAPAPLSGSSMSPMSVSQTSHAQGPRRLFHTCRECLGGFRDLVGLSHVCGWGGRVGTPPPSLAPRMAPWDSSFPRVVPPGQGGRG